jgi:RNA polymerase sigma-70 factor (ECF subfamily)
MDEAAFGSWLKRIQVNHCLSFMRKRKGRSFVDVDNPAAAIEPELVEEPRAEEHAEASEERNRIRATLDRIPDTLRVPLVMRDLDDLSYQEIADALGIGLSAVKMRIKRGRELFRELYGATRPTESPR